MGRCFRRLPRRTFARIETGDVPDQAVQVGPAFVVHPALLPAIQPRVSHTLPTAAVFVWGIAPVDSPWKTLPAKSATEPFAPAAGDSAPTRVRPPRHRRRVFHASSTAPVPSRTGGAVGEGWETQLHTPIEWGDVSVGCLGERSPGLKRAIFRIRRERSVASALRVLRQHPPNWFPR